MLPYLHAQEVQIRLSGDRLSFDPQPEGALVLPRTPGEVSEVLRGSVPASSADGLVAYQPAGARGVASWTIQRSVPGRYDFVLSSPSGDPGYRWPSRTKVELAMDGKVRTFTPPEGTGGVWFVFSLAGVSRDLIEGGFLLPRTRLAYGVVRDALTGRPLEGARVDLVARVGKQVVATVQTDADGIYFLEAPAAGMRFDLNFSYEDAIGVTERIDWQKEEFPRRIDTALTGKLLQAQYRFVLSWSDRPRDLDAHLTGPDPQTGTDFHISFRNMRSWSGRHFLDVDDQDGFGPETITVTRLDPGAYRFLVHDWSDQDRPSSAGLAASQATVRVYREDRMVAEFPVPGGTGVLWDVCSIDGATGRIVPGSGIVAP